MLSQERAFNEALNNHEAAGAAERVEESRAENEIMPPLQRLNARLVAVEVALFCLSLDRFECSSTFDSIDDTSSKLKTSASKRRE